jgi:hypothetical protein
MTNPCPPCPQCGDRYTQSLPLAFEAGPGGKTRTWRSNRGSCGTPVSEAQIASRAKPPARRSVVKPALLLVAVCLFLGVPIVSVMTTALRAALSHTQTALPDGLPAAQPASLARTLVSFAPPVLVLFGVSGYLDRRAPVQSDSLSEAACGLAGLFDLQGVRDGLPAVGDGSGHAIAGDPRELMRVRIQLGFYLASLFNSRREAG